MRDAPAEQSQLRGQYERSHGRLTPTAASVATVDLPQADRLRHLLSLADTALGPDKDRERRPCGCRPLPTPCGILGRISSPGSPYPRRSTTCLEGPSTAATRESDCDRPHPRCLPPLRLLYWLAAVFPPPPTSVAHEVTPASDLEVERLPGSVILHRLSNPDTFVTADSMALTGSMRRQLSRAFRRAP